MFKYINTKKKHRNNPNTYNTAIVMNTRCGIENVTRSGRYFTK